MSNCNSSTLAIVLFDMDGTLLDFSFDDFIWNQCLPERHAQVHQCTLNKVTRPIQFYQQHKHTLSWYSSAYWTAKVGVDV
jgi:putative hydrolase of the HAD superfamily